MEAPREQSGQLHANLYLLAVGVLVGVLLGPFALGRWSPETYDRLFPLGEAGETLQAFDAEMERRLEAAQRIGATGQYLPELQASLEAERVELLREIEPARARLIEPYKVALLLALVVIMTIESLQARPGSRVAMRLATIRYALAALWLALLLAVPYPLMNVSVLFVALLVIVALLVGLVPVPGRAARSETE